MTADGCVAIALVVENLSEGAYDVSRPNWVRDGHFTCSVRIAD